MNNMFEKIKDSMAERILNKIIDEKQTVITISFQDNGQPYQEGISTLERLIDTKSVRAAITFEKKEG